MRLLVTGGAGFIGSNLVHYVLAHTEVEQLVNLDCLTYAGSLENLAGVTADRRYRFEHVDLRQREEVLGVFERHRITHVMHLAAESHVDRSIAAPADFIHTNLVGTFHLLEAARAVGVERLLHVSTDEVYGSLDAHGAFTETTPYAPRSPYSASKAASEIAKRFNLNRSDIYQRILTMKGQDGA